MIFILMNTLYYFVRSVDLYQYEQYFNYIKLLMVYDNNHCYLRKNIVIYL